MNFDPNFVGFFRTMQPEIITLVVVIALIFIAALFMNALFDSQKNCGEDVETPRIFFNVFMSIIAIFVLVCFGLSAFSSFSKNRMPRQDVDRTGIYQQMDSNLKK